MYSDMTQEKLKNSMLDTARNVDKTESSMVHDAINPAAIEMANFYMQLGSVANKLDIENLSGAELERFIAGSTPLTRKIGTPANGVVTISGQEGAKISIGAIVSTGDVDFIIMEETTIPASGSVNVAVESQQIGAIGNVPANTIIEFPLPIQGLVDVYNAEPTTGGYEPESDDEFRERYYAKLQRPGKAGNKYHYEEWAMEVVGVGDVRVYPIWNGPLTVKVVVVDSNRQPPDEELVQSVTDYIEEQRPFGATVTVEGAAPKTIDIAVTLTLDTGYLLADVTEDIRLGIEEYFKTLSFTGTAVSWAKIGGIVIDTPGVLDYQNLTVNLGTANIPLTETEVPVIGTITAT